MEYGYVRVSTEDQNVERQVVKMLELGISEDNIFIDKASGKNMDRDDWKRLMGVIADGDFLAIDSLDRLGRNYDDITREWKRITRDIGCDIKALDLDFFDSRKFKEMGDIGKCIEDMLLSLLAWKAETDRTTMLARQAEGIAVAKKDGKYKGRAPKSFDGAIIEEANRIIAECGKSAAARYLGVTRLTVYNMIEDGRLVDAGV